MSCKYNIKKSMGKPSAFLHILFHADDKSYENIETFGQNTYVNDVMLFLSWLRFDIPQNQNTFLPSKICFKYGLPINIHISQSHYAPN